MTNEIKEIIEALKPHNDIVKEYPLTLSIEEQKILLDYITNLQEENEHLDKVNCQLRKKINNDIYKQRIDKTLDYINDCPSDKYLKSSKIIELLNELKELNEEGK